MSKRIKSTWMFATLSAADDAILRATSSKQLLQRVCDAILEGGELIASAALEVGPGGEFRYAAFAGGRVAELCRASVDATSADGPGLAVIALHTGHPCITNDLPRAERVRIRREMGMHAGIGAAAAVPVVRNGSVAGVFLLFFAGWYSLDDAAVRLWTRLAENVAFALDKLEREEETARLACMVSALSATNEAIMRAETREKLFDLVCEAAVLGGKFTATTIALAEPGNDFLRIVAVTGPSAELSRTVRVALSVTSKYWLSPHAGIVRSSGRTAAATS